MFKPALVSLCLLLAVSVLRAAEALAAPRDVHFHSVNLKNTVHWSPGTADAPGTTYTLEYAIYGDSVNVGGDMEVAWRLVEQCADISRTECDVTEQTSDTEEEYYVRVRANGPNGRSEWTETERRLQLTDTILGPPLVNVSVVENKLQVKLSGPFRWRKTGKKRQSMFNIFPHMMYNISVYNNKSKHTLYLRTHKKLLQHGPLEYNSEYCVQAEVFSQSLHLSNVPSKWTCVSTGDDPVKSQMQFMMLGGVIPTAICLFVLATVCSFAYYYICGHKPGLPRSVKDIQQDVHAERKLQMFQPEKHQPIINILIINSTNLSTGESKCSFLDPFLPGADALDRLPITAIGGATYASQNIQQPSEAPSAGLQNSHRSLKEDYGFVHQGDLIQVPCSTYSPQSAPGGVSSYMAQTGTTEPAQLRYEDDDDDDEETQMFCNWDPDTGHLQLDFPLLRRFGSEATETPKRNGEDVMVVPLCHPVLTSVVVKQASEEAGDDDLLLKMEKDWDLQIPSTLE